MRAALVRSILARKPRLRKTRSTARPELSGPRVKKKLARTPAAARSASSAGTPSRVPRKVSTSIFSATRGGEARGAAGIVGDSLANTMGRRGGRLGHPRAPLRRRAEPVDGAAQALFERHLRLDAQDGAHAGDVREAARDVLVGVAVDVLLAHQFHLRAGEIGRASCRERV